MSLSLLSDVRQIPGVKHLASESILMTRIKAAEITGAAAALGINQEGVFKWMYVLNMAFRLVEHGTNQPLSDGNH